MTSFTTPLIVSPVDGKYWLLCYSLVYHIGSKYSREWIRVPAGFVTDFASSPPQIWWLIPPWGRYGKAAVIHDYLYKTHMKTRKEADNIFHEAMSIMGVEKWRIFLMYWAVRLFGWMAW